MHRRFAFVAHMLVRARARKRFFKTAEHICACIGFYHLSSARMLNSSLMSFHVEPLIKGNSLKSFEKEKKNGYYVYCAYTSFVLVYFIQKHKAYVFKFVSRCIMNSKIVLPESAAKMKKNFFLFGINNIEARKCPFWLYNYETQFDINRNIYNCKQNK